VIWQVKITEEYDWVTWRVLIGEKATVKRLALGEQGKKTDRVMGHDSYGKGG
jgi:hypothetical protein